MTIYSLYKYTNLVNGKGYVGITKDTERRFGEHESYHGGGARAFDRAIKKYGLENFARRVLAIFDDANAAAYHEQAAIVGLKTLAPNGYNLVAGAPATEYYSGHPHSAETRARISAKLKGKPKAEEVRRNMSAAQVGNKHNLGHPCSDEKRERIRASNMGHSVSDETRAKISAAGLGRKNPHGSTRGKKP